MSNGPPHTFVSFMFKTGYFLILQPSGTESKTQQKSNACIFSKKKCNQLELRATSNYLHSIESPPFIKTDKSYFVFSHMIRHVTRMTMMNMTTQSNKHPSCEIIPYRAIYMFNLRTILE